MWQQVEEKTSKIPQPEPVYLTPSNIRLFLDLPGLLAPPKKGPDIDPIRFQRLDHFFVRRQWLGSVLNFRSKLHTGFPSDHYLLVRKVRVKLANKKKSLLRPPLCDLQTTTPEVKTQFNMILKELLQDTEVESQNIPKEPDHNATHHLYTDGSGSGGRCTEHTPAGWGWCFKEEEQWVEAHGPATTDPSQNTYRGAAVGSNNTGEVTAFVEAILFAHQQGWHKITIHTDSQWAINTLKGRWKAKCHHDLIQLAKKLSRFVKTHFQWVKGHSGQEGNERAD